MSIPTNIHRLPCPRGADPALETADPARVDRPGGCACCGLCRAGTALRARGRSSRPGRSADPRTGQDAARTGDHTRFGGIRAGPPRLRRALRRRPPTRDRTTTRRSRGERGRALGAHQRRARSSPGPAGTATAATRRPRGRRRSLEARSRAGRGRTSRRRPGSTAREHLQHARRTRARDPGRHLSERRDRRPCTRRRFRPGLTGVGPCLRQSPLAADRHRRRQGS